jgi:hypothetical protein
VRDTTRAEAGISRSHDLPKSQLWPGGKPHEELDERVAPLSGLALGSCPIEGAGTSARQLQSAPQPLRRLRGRDAIRIPVPQRKVQVSKQERFGLRRELVCNLLEIGRETAGHPIALPSLCRMLWQAV